MTNIAKHICPNCQTEAQTDIQDSTQHTCTNCATVYTVCQACHVVLYNDLAYFSYGKPGSRSKLSARVCQYAKNKDTCQNSTTTPDMKQGYTEPMIPMETAKEWLELL
jgi:hypothetical protein